MIHLVMIVWKFDLVLNPIFYTKIRFVLCSSSTKSEGGRSTPSSLYKHMNNLVRVNVVWISARRNRRAKKCEIQVLQSRCRR